MYVSQKHIIKTINKIQLHCSQRHFIKYIRVGAVKGKEMGVGVGGEGEKKKNQTWRTLPRQTDVECHRWGGFLYTPKKQTIKTQK